MRRQCRNCGQLFESLETCPRCGMAFKDPSILDDDTIEDYTGADDTVLGWTQTTRMGTHPQPSFHNQPGTPVSGFTGSPGDPPPPVGQTPWATASQPHLQQGQMPPYQAASATWSHSNLPGGKGPAPSKKKFSPKWVALSAVIGVVVIAIVIASSLTLMRFLGNTNKEVTAPVVAEEPVVPQAPELSVTGDPWSSGNGSSGAVPSGVPACPTEMSPVSWVQRDNGSLVVCRGSDGYKVQLEAQPELHAVELAFHPDSYRVTFEDKSQILVALGGLVVQSGDSNELLASSRAWNARHGELEGFAPGGLPSCPTETWPISLSSFTDGWLMVCGTDNGPVSMKFSGAGIGTGEATAVKEKNGSFCASVMSQETCVSESPALVTINDSRGAVSQATVSHNWFPGVGPGGAGQGSGFSEVEAPGPTGEDQVRYLVDILRESAAARSQLNPAVDNVSRCRNLLGAIQTIESVTQNRYDLLMALDSTPVDQIDGGFQLISLLRESLETSYDADLAWLAWAESERDNGCAYGSKSSLYKNAQSVNKRVDRPKNSFVNMWNSQIAPKYNVRKFTRAEI